MLYLSQILRASISSINDRFKWITCFYMSLVLATENYLIDWLDTIVYYAMNSLVLMLNFVEIITEMYDNLYRNAKLVHTGYQNGFFSNIN